MLLTSLSNCSMKVILPFPVWPSSSSSCLDSGCGDTIARNASHRENTSRWARFCMESKCKMHTVTWIWCIWVSLLLIPDFFGNVFLNLSKCWVTLANISLLRSSFSNVFLQIIHFMAMQLSRAVQRSAQHSKIKHGYMFRSKVCSFQNLWKYFVLKMCMCCLSEISLLNLNKQQNLKPFISSQLSIFSHSESSVTWPSIFISGLISQNFVSSPTCWVGWLIQA